MKRIESSLRHSQFMLILFTTLFTGLVVHAAPSHASPIFIEGYTGQTSVAPGEEVTLHISTSVAKYAVEIKRLGAKDELVWSRNDVPGQAYPVPEKASSHGTEWPESIRIAITEEWRSGYYQVSLRAADNGGKFVERGRRSAESSCFFIVRSATPGKDTKILLQLATNTYNAYNNWGGFSLYAYNGRGGIQGNRVSFDRPPASLFGNWELHFVRWAETNGYKIDYAANSDLEFRPEILQQYKLVLSVGHD